MNATKNTQLKTLHKYLHFLGHSWRRPIKQPLINLYFKSEIWIAV